MVFFHCLILKIIPPKSGKPIISYKMGNISYFRVFPLLIPPFQALYLVKDPWNVLWAHKGKTLKITNTQRTLDRNFWNFRFRIVGFFLSSPLLKGTMNKLQFYIGNINCHIWIYCRQMSLDVLSPSHKSILYGLK